MLFRHHAQEVLEAHQGRPQTITSYARIVHRWLNRLLGDTPLASITPRDVAFVLAHLREADRSEKTVQNILICLRMILQRAVDWGHIEKNPCDGFHVRVPKSGFTVLTPEQRDALDAVLAEGEGQEALLRVILWTGIRLREAELLGRDAFDLERMTLYVRESKTDSGVRIVDVPDKAADALRDREHGGRLFFAYSRTTLRRRLAAACQKAGVPQVRIHDLRHTRITTLLLAGVPVGYVSKQAGHASPAFTLKRYDHWVRVVADEQRRTWANA